MSVRPKGMEGGGNKLLKLMILSFIVGWVIALLKD